jgi:hypothetical protein
METLFIAFKQESNQEQIALLRLKSLWWQCPKGFTQTEWVDYSEIYSPVAKFNYILIILSMSLAEDIQWILVHWSFIIYKMHSFNSSTLCGSSDEQRMINWNCFHSLITSKPLHKPEVVKFSARRALVRMSAPMYKSWTRWQIWKSQITWYCMSISLVCWWYSGFEKTPLAFWLST